MMMMMTKTMMMTTMMLSSSSLSLNFRTDAWDRGSHTVCAVMTEDFLQYTKSMGNDLSTPRWMMILMMMKMTMMILMMTFLEYIKMDGDICDDYLNGDYGFYDDL